MRREPAGSRAGSASSQRARHVLETERGACGLPQRQRPRGHLLEREHVRLALPDRGRLLDQGLRPARDVPGDQANQARARSATSSGRSSGSRCPPSTSSTSARWNVVLDARELRHGLHALVAPEQQFHGQLDPRAGEPPRRQPRQLAQLEVAVQEARRMRARRLAQHVGEDGGVVRAHRARERPAHDPPVAHERGPQHGRGERILVELAPEVAATWSRARSTGARCSPASGARSAQAPGCRAASRPTRPSRGPDSRLARSRARRAARACRRRSAPS